MQRLDENYISLVKDILENGHQKGDRTGTGTRSVFGRQFRHNMKDGFPLLTTKKMAWKTMVTELIYFLRGETDIKYLVDNKCRIWNGDLAKYHGVNIDDYETLVKTDSNLYEGGALYPYQWRNFGGGNYGRKRITIPFITNFKSFAVGDDAVRYKTKDYGEYVIIGTLQLGERNETHYEVQFLNTKSIKIIRKDKLNTNIVDVYSPSKLGVACVGSYDKSLPNLSKIKNIWNSMIDRCYNTENDNYMYYGGKGVYVENRWLCLEYFIEDLSKIKQWDLKIKAWDDFNLDKDVFGCGFKYSLENCCWLHKSDNTRKSKEKYLYTITNGTSSYEFVNHVDFLTTFKVKNQGNFASMLRGDRINCEGWSLVNKTLISNGVDQIQTVINQLKNEPDSRRIIVTSWNPNQLINLSLPACHNMFQFYTRELTYDEMWDSLTNKEKRGITKSLVGETYNGIDSRMEDINLWVENFNKPRRAISLLFNMRSSDVGLGLPFNIASYGLLLQLIGRVVNMVPEELIGNLGDTHLYSNHIDPIKEQLNRVGYELPTVKFSDSLNKSIKEKRFDVDLTKWIESIKPEDFILENYVSHPKIVLPLSN